MVFRINFNEVSTLVGGYYLLTQDWSFFTDVQRFENIEDIKVTLAFARMYHLEFGADALRQTRDVRLHMFCNG